MGDFLQGIGKGKDLSAKTAYMPTVEACWDYGIARNAPLLPFIGSLLPYNFLRGVQFDTKVFKIWELVAAGGQNLKGLITGLAARNEVTLRSNDDKTWDSIQDIFEQSYPKPLLSTDGAPSFSIEQGAAIEEEVKEWFLYGAAESVSIAVDGDSDLTASITNKWGAGEDMLTQMIDGVSQIIKNISELGRTINATVGGSDIASVPFSPARYQGTDFGTITLNFTLFTRNNYVRDIHFPLMRLKAMCMPSKTNLQPSDIIKEASVAAVTELGVTITEEEAKKKVAAIASNKYVGTAAAILNSRSKVVKPPPTFSVQHNARMFFMKKAAITNFTFKPEGPWVRMEYDGLFGKIANQFGWKTVATALDRLLQDVYVKFPSYPEMCYPTRIKCSMTLKETEFIALNDYIAEDKGYLTPLVVASVGSSLDPGQLAASIIAGGTAQNLDILIPDIKGAGDLLSGGKWVPPGETITGIPGFL